MIPSDMLPAAIHLTIPAHPEDRRLSFRRNAKIRQQENLAMQKQRQEHEALIRDIDNQKEEAAARHIAECKPKQERQAQIINDQVVEVVDGIPKDPKLEAERVKLQGEIDRLNDALRDTIAITDKKIEGIRQEINKLPSAQPPEIFERELMELGSPRLLDEWLSASIAAWWAKQRWDFAVKVRNEYGERVQSAKNHYRPKEEYTGLEEAYRKFESECTFAAAALHDASAEADRLREEIINE